MTPVLRVLLALGIVGIPIAAVGATDDGSSSEIELTEPGTSEEMTVESEDAPKPPPPAPAPAAPAAPKPAPAPAPAPRPPAPPPSPWQWLMIEDFDRATPGRDVGALEGAAPVQFTMRLLTPGHDGPQAMMLQGVPAFSDGSVWAWKPPAGRSLNLAAWRGVSLWVRASQSVGELRIGVAGGGSVWTAVPLGGEWTEARLDFARDTGRGRFDPSRVTGIYLSVAHEGTVPLDVTIDTITAWRDRVPSDALNLGMNVPPAPGPGDWTPSFHAVNCSWRASAAEGFVLGFWTGEVPYVHRPITALWGELPRGLRGATALVAQARLDPPQPVVFLKFTLVERDGEQFSSLRALPVEGPVRIPLAEFGYDLLANQRTPPARIGNGLLDAADVAAWRLEIVPATERPAKGTIFVRELWVEGRMKPAPRPPVKGLFQPVTPGAAPAAAAAPVPAQPAVPAAAPPAAAEAAPAEAAPESAPREEGSEEAAPAESGTEEEGL